MGIGPVFAIPKLLDRAGLTVADIGLWELNEAFASQCLYCRDHLGIDPPPATYDESSWRQAAGATVFAPAGGGADHLNGRNWAINFRVRDLDAMVAHYGRDEMLGLYDGLEAAMGEAKDIKPNLDYPAGPTYHLMGFDTEMFTPIFIASRITGWTAHIMEQRAANALIRPLSAYDGPDQRELPQG